MQQHVSNWVGLNLTALESNAWIWFPIGTQVTRVGVVNAVYEARAIPGDHKQKEEDGGVSSFGGGGGPAF